MNYIADNMQRQLSFVYKNLQIIQVYTCKTLQVSTYLFCIYIYAK